MVMCIVFIIVCIIRTLDNAKTPDVYIVQAVVNDDVVLGEGRGPTLKIAQLKAAQDGLNRHYSLYVTNKTPIQHEYEQLLQAKTKKSNNKQ